MSNNDSIKRTACAIAYDDVKRGQGWLDRNELAILIEAAIQRAIAVTNASWRKTCRDCDRDTYEIYEAALDEGMKMEREDYTRLVELWCKRRFGPLSKWVYRDIMKFLDAR